MKWLMVLLMVLMGGLGVSLGAEPVRKPALRYNNLFGRDAQTVGEVDFKHRKCDEACRKALDRRVIHLMGDGVMKVSDVEVVKALNRH